MAQDPVTIRINLGDWGTSLKDLETRIKASASAANAADAPYYCGTNK
jgi:hypothetical protein